MRLSTRWSQPSGVDVNVDRRAFLGLSSAVATAAVWRSSPWAAAAAGGSSAPAAGTGSGIAGVAATKSGPLAAGLDGAGSPVVWALQKDASGAYRPGKVLASLGADFIPVGCQSDGTTVRVFGGRWTDYSTQTFDDTVGEGDAAQVVSVTVAFQGIAPAVATLQPGSSPNFSTPNGPESRFSVVTSVDDATGAYVVAYSSSPDVPYTDLVTLVTNGSKQEQVAPDLVLGDGDSVSAVVVSGETVAFVDRWVNGNSAVAVKQAGSRADSVLQSSRLLAVTTAGRSAVGLAERDGTIYRWRSDSGWASNWKGPTGADAYLPVTGRSEPVWAAVSADNTVRILGEDGSTYAL